MAKCFGIGIRSTCLFNLKAKIPCESSTDQTLVPNLLRIRLHGVGSTCDLMTNELTHVTRTCRKEKRATCTRRVVAWNWKSANYQPLSYSHTSFSKSGVNINLNRFHYGPLCEYSCTSDIYKNIIIVCKWAFLNVILILIYIKINPFESSLGHMVDALLLLLLGLLCLETLEFWKFYFWK